MPISPLDRLITKFEKLVDQAENATSFEAWSSKANEAVYEAGWLLKSYPRKIWFKLMLDQFRFRGCGLFRRERKKYHQSFRWYFLEGGGTKKECEQVIRIYRKMKKDIEIIKDIQAMERRIRELEKIRETLCS